MGLIEISIGRKRELGNSVLVTRKFTFREPAAAQSCYAAHINYHMREYTCKLWHILLEGGEERDVRQRDSKNDATYSIIIIRTKGYTDALTVRYWLVDKLVENYILFLTKLLHYNETYIITGLGSVPGISGFLLRINKFINFTIWTGSPICQMLFFVHNILNWITFYLILPPFQIVRRFDFSRFTDIIMHLDISLIFSLTKRHWIE